MLEAALRVGQAVPMKATRRSSILISLLPMLLLVACQTSDQGRLSWQITPRVLLEAMDNPDRAAAKRSMDAMMTMRKIDIAAIEATLAGESSK